MPGRSGGRERRDVDCSLQQPEVSCKGRWPRLSSATLSKDLLEGLEAKAGSA